MPAPRLCARPPAFRAGLTSSLEYAKLLYMNKAMLTKAEGIAGMLACIAHPSRLMIICMLLKREMFVHEVIEKLGTTKGNISQHLRVLADRGLIQKRRDGNRIFYSVKDPNLKELISGIKKLYCPNFDL